MAQIIQPLRLGGGKAHGGDSAAVVTQAACILLGFGQQVDFVVQQDLRQVVGMDFGQHIVHVFDFAFVFGVGRIDHVEQHVCQCGFFQRGGESGHQFMRQVLHETDGIGQDDAVFGREIQFARGGVERGEKLVFGQYVGFGKAVEQCGFAGIRVAHDGKGFHAAGLACLAACFALFFHLRQLSAQGGDFCLNQAAVGFELGLAGAFQADAAFLALQVPVSAHQPSSQMGQLRQFDLQPAFL